MGKTDVEKLQLFESQEIRTAWDAEKEEWYFAIVDVVKVLTDAKDYDAARNYWKVTKYRMIEEGNELVTKCNQLKLKSPKDGKSNESCCILLSAERIFRCMDKSAHALYRNSKRDDG